MTYTHLTTDELVLIESYFHFNQPVSYVAQKLGCAKQTIYNVYRFLESGQNAIDFYQCYKENKKRYGRSCHCLFCANPLSYV